MENNQLVPFASQTVTPEGLYLYGLGQAINKLVNERVFTTNGGEAAFHRCTKIIHECAMDVIKETKQPKDKP